MKKQIVKANCNNCGHKKAVAYKDGRLKCMRCKLEIK